MNKKISCKIICYTDHKETEEIRFLCTLYSVKDCDFYQSIPLNGYNGRCVHQQDNNCTCSKAKIIALMKFHEEMFKELEEMHDKNPDDFNDPAIVDLAKEVFK